MVDNYNKARQIALGFDLVVRPECSRETFGYLENGSKGNPQQKLGGGVRFSRRRLPNHNRDTTKNKKPVHGVRSLER